MTLTKGQIYYRRYKDNIRAYNNRNRFGGNRIKALERDKWTCVKCGMTNDEHKLKYKRGLNVDHIDGRGSNLPKKEQNNNMDNLQTLCNPCHTRKDVSRNKMPLSKPVIQMDLKGNFIKLFPSLKSVERETGILNGMVLRVITGERHKCHGYVFKYF